MNKGNNHLRSGRTNQSGGRPQSSSYYKDAKPIKLPESYLEEGYFDSEGLPRRELYVEMAEEVAKKFGVVGDSSSRLRKYYNEVRTIWEVVNADKNGSEKAFHSNRHRLYKLRATASYDSNREDGRSSRILYDFINKNVQIAEKSLKHYKVFMDHFMCIMGYFKENGGKSKW
ncbi:type III-A CRISPR-associated protein Csm2 [Paenibacillus apiarius]|uniref:type III-A CRISPR-associated protein Csm2 n=1 Tax=Paenibacillus apiarius TaxID=46240 RepID=UPI003B3A01DA